MSFGFSRAISFVLCVFASFPAFSQKTLVPQPQLLNYKGGELVVDSVFIAFKGNATPSDSIAIREIVRVFEEAGVSEIGFFRAGDSRKPNVVLNRIDGGSELPAVSEEEGESSREYYEMEVSSTEISIEARTSAGIFWAAQTLKQLIVQKGDSTIVCHLSIKDWPSMPYRGFMMDMTHMQFPTIQEIKRQLDFLSHWKVNQYYFYSEVNIELDGYPLLAPEARYTKQEMKEIIDYARSRFIDIVPNINLYGHLHDLLKYEHYTDMAITPYGREFNSTHPRRDSIVSDWVGQFSQLFESPFMHIGFDETWLINFEAERLGRPASELYLESLNSALNEVHRHGKMPVIYADMLQKYPEIVDKVSNDFIPVPWHYTPVGKDRYASYFEPFEERKIPFFVQSATLNYFYIYPAYSLSLENHRRLFREGVKSRANGFIMSGWTDDTQALMRSSRPDMAFGGAISWNYSNTSDTLFFREYAQIIYSPSVGEYWIEAQLALVEAERLTRKVFGITNEAIWKNPFLQKNQSKFIDKRGEIRRARYLIECAQIQLKEALKHGEDQVTFEAMYAASKELELLTMRYLFAGRIIDIHRSYQYTRDNKEFKGMMAEVVGLISSLTNDINDCVVETKEAFVNAWLNEYTPYRLEIAKAKFDRELLFWLRAKDRLKELLDVEESEELPLLEDLLDINY